jgi:hypothetical protein
VEEWLPWLYLKGVSTGDFSEALSSLLRSEAKGLSPATIGRLKAKWSEEHQTWQQRSLRHYLARLHRKTLCYTKSDLFAPGLSGRGDLAPTVCWAGNRGYSIRIWYYSDSVDMLVYSVRLLMHYLKFGDVLVPARFIS